MNMFQVSVLCSLIIDDTKYLTPFKIKRSSMFWVLSIYISFQYNDCLTRVKTENARSENKIMIFIHFITRIKLLFNIIFPFENI